jgi:hypothetical protein
MIKNERIDVAERQGKKFEEFIYKENKNVSFFFFIEENRTRREKKSLGWFFLLHIAWL